ncbi:MAG: hypothetical protein KDI82_05400 [Gammaproteobacteria bacterium]|nr:hypothetical protein [Gammaproteobacteria bacterium]
MTMLNSIDSLLTTVAIGPLQPLLEQVLGPVFDHLEMAQFFESEEDGVLSYTLILGVKQSVLLPLPGFDAIALGIVRTSDDEMPLILAELVFEGAPLRVAIRHFPLRVVIDNPLLLPVPTEDGTALDGFSFEIEGAFSVAADLAVHAELESFSLPPFTIDGTGLLLGLEQCRLVMHEDDVDDDLVALGFDSTFRGFHAASAQVYWDIPFQVAGMDLPGLRADLENLALGNQGVSVAATLTWPVVHDGAKFDAAQTELLGQLFGWAFAFEQLDLVIERNVPIGSLAIGYLRVPLLDRIVRVELGYREADGDGYRFHLRIAQADPPIEVALGDDSYTLQLANLVLEGSFTSEGEFALDGRADITLDLPGLQVSTSGVEIALEHLDSHDALRISLPQVVIDGYGQVDDAQLVAVFAEDADGDYAPQMLELIGSVVWRDISDRIQLDTGLPWLPLPPDDAELTLRALWVGDQLQFTLDAALDDVDQLWRFVPQAARPEVEDARIEIALVVDGSDFSGELGLAFALRLPDLASIGPLAAAGLADVIAIETGDETGLIHLRFVAEIGNSDGDATGRLVAEVEDALSLSLQLPGLVLPEAPLQVAINEVAITFGADGDELEGSLQLGGDFVLRPILPDTALASAPPLITQQLDRLLQVARSVDLSGSATLTVGFAADNAWFATDCTFDRAGLELDLFDMLASATGTAGTLLDSGGANEIDLDIDVAAELQRIHLSIGSEEPADQGIAFGFGIEASFSFAGQTADLGFELTHEGLSFGLDRLRIPIAIPKLPLSRGDLDRLRDAAGQWDYVNRWQGDIESELDGLIEDENDLLDDALRRLDDLRDNDGDAYALFEVEFREIPAIRKRLFDLAGRKFLYQAVLAVHQMLGRLGVDGSQSTYQQGVEVYQDAVDVVLGSLHVDSLLQFEISDVRFMLPFNDPSDIRVEGGASITGFAPDDPLAPLGDLVFKLGLSADAIYFAVEGGASPIPLPDVGRYPGSAVHLDRLVIGYGYSKNSLKIDFAGELILSPQLVDDADTSQELGFGVRLPQNSKLQFKLDLIPVTLGEIEFVIPLVAFDIDLRSDRPPLPAAAGSCRPEWDGLQLHVPGIVRADLKRYAFSPFFGPLPATNYDYSYDLEIGNDEMGLRHVADYRAIAPIAGTIPVPFLADLVPFFERYCLDLRLAGFEIGFDLARPFPKPGPLLIFELLGFLSDTSLPIDPNGQIAGLMYAQLQRGRITVPARVQALFPAANSVVGRNLSARVDVTTVIALFQQMRALWDTLQQRVANSSTAGIDWVEDIIANPPQLAVGQILHVLPESMRTLRLEGRFLHFEASATLMLALADEIAADYGDNSEPAPPPPSGGAFEPVYANDFNSTSLAGWQRYNRGLKRGQGNWRVVDGQLLQDNNVGDNSPGRYGAMLIYEQIEIDDLRLLVTASSSDNDGLGVVFHFQDERTFYRFRMTEEQKEWRLDKLDGGRVTTLFRSEQRFKRDKRYDIRIETVSRAGGSAALPLRNNPADRRPVLSLDIDGLLSAREKLPMSVTRIRVWVDGIAWCDVDDRVDALTHGHIGLDSWWNSGARFDNLQLYARWQPVLGIGHEVPADALPALASTLTGPVGEPPAALAAFSAVDIAEALADAPAVAVTLAARVRLAGSQVFEMLGWITGDGRYGLRSRLGLPPLSLAVAGISVPLPLQLAGRVSLAGHSAGADSYVAAEASVYADWTVLPGAQNQPPLARVLIGSGQHPVTLRLNSDREFLLRGDGQLQLFAQQVVITGAFDVSHAHALVEGSLDFTPELFIGGQRLLSLQADVQGQIGPGRALQLQGAGSLSLFERAFAAGSVRIAERVIELAAELGAGPGANGRIASWSPAGLPLKQVRLALAGQLDFNPPVPRLALQGEGGFTLHGAQVEGACRIEAQGNDWLMAASGRLFWQGRNWIDGALVLRDEGIEISGRADFGLGLTPTQLPAGIEIAGLHLHATVSGRFTLNAAGQLVAWSFDLDWQLAVRLPGTDNKQALPIATQQLSINGSHAGGGDVLELVDLVAFNGLTLFDLEQFEIPVPTIDLRSGRGIYLRNGLDIDVDGDGAETTVLTPIPPSDNATPAYTVPLIGMNFYEDDVAVDLPSLSLPVPVLSTEDINGEAPLLRVPTPAMGSVPLGRIRFENTAFALKLAWQEGQLGVLVAGEDRFVPFANNLFLSIVVALDGGIGG